MNVIYLEKHQGLNFRSKLSKHVKIENIGLNPRDEVT